MSVDPQYGELSRAMRNRGIEDALSINSTSDDSAIFQDHTRLPLDYRDEVCETKPFSSGRLLDQEPASSSLLDRACLRGGPTIVIYHFLVRTVTPPYTAHFSRFIGQTGGVVNDVVSSLQAVPRKCLGMAIASLWDAYARS
ncbi:hypothetical protein GGX14DRAFT_570566 [Mycena pura]|uniref:Uncharacterized protein n=1 Tax=Mycena pura TaxID=153505 RepID=A0AAD6V5C2_9AGAR|nr:hypothetical protein GGX14DRAFT_570566 [Mycena pura]